MSKITVAVLFGGSSVGHEVSIMSAINIMNGLREEKYNIVPIYITTEGNWFLYDGAIDSIKRANLRTLDIPAFLCPDTKLGPIIRIAGERARNIPIDIVFPAIHGKYGEDGAIQGLCELARVPYVGCGIPSSSLCMDKQLIKLTADAIGLKQAKYLCFTRSDAEDIDSVYKQARSKIKLPCFVKPANSRFSSAVSKADNKKSFEAAVEQALSYDKKFIVERTVDGREIKLALLGALKPETSCIGEIVSENNDCTSENVTKIIINPELPEGKADEICACANKIFKAVDGFGPAEVKFFLESGTNNLVFDKINTMPEFTPNGTYPLLWRESGVGLYDLCEKLVQLGLQRYDL